MNSPSTHKPTRESAPATGKRYRSLNELHFVERDEFLLMAPAVVRLEITRLTDMAGSLEPGSEAHTAAVAARHRLRLFLDGLGTEDGSRLSSGDMRSASEGPATEHLEAAIVCLSAAAPGVDSDTCDSMIYVADRLGYIAGQMRRLR